ncbi:hypothetical protein ES708_00733 [subsurface metagenome]
MKNDELGEWPCQQLLGGTGAAIYSSIDGMCKHPECHPRNDERRPNPPLDSDNVRGLKCET